MGGGASSQANKQPAIAVETAKQSLPAANTQDRPRPQPADNTPSPHGKEKEQTESPRISPRALDTGNNRQEEGATNNQIDSPVASSRELSRRSSESSMHDEDEQHSDGLNEENMDALAFSAMSLGMDNEELLFNMYYFGEEAGTGFRQSMNTAIEETYAAHSTGNTPYKLRPASEGSIHKHLTADIDLSEVGESEECLICQELLRDPEQGSMVMISACKHVFHEECVLRWFTLQNWCPICRAVISPDEKEEEEGKANHSTNSEHQRKANGCIPGSCETPAEWCAGGAAGPARSLDSAMALAAEV